MPEKPPERPKSAATRGGVEGWSEPVRSSGQRYPPRNGNGSAWATAWDKFREVLPIAIVIVGGSIGYMELRMDAKIHAKVPPPEVTEALDEIRDELADLNDKMSTVQSDVAVLKDRSHKHMSPAGIIIGDE